MFSAADDEQWKIITRQIDECDYYAVIVAHRYGSLVDGVSYTEKEYDYAASKGIPILGFVIEKHAPWPNDRVDNEPHQRDALDRFKAKIKNKPVGFWTTATDLHGKFSIALTKQIAMTPRPGWARATDVAGPDVVKELARLSSENANLRQQLLESRQKAENDVASERSRIIRLMHSNEANLCFWYKNSKEWEDHTEVGLYSLFFLLAPEMMIEKSTEEIAEFVGQMKKVDKNRALRQDFPVPSNVVKHLISDFIALNLFEPSRNRHSVQDKTQYWSLTKLGREVYTQIRHENFMQNDSKLNALLNSIAIGNETDVETNGKEGDEHATPDN